jgi:hypothetical protein
MYCSVAGGIFIGTSYTCPSVYPEGNLAGTVTHTLGRAKYLPGAVAHPLGSEKYSFSKNSYPYPIGTTIVKWNKWQFLVDRIGLKCL